MVVYDYKFPTLAKKLYYHYKKNQREGKLPKGCKFNIINFVDVEYSKRVNPIQLKYINNLAAASETAETLLESLHKGKKEGGGGSDQFFQTSAVNFLAACIFFFCNYRKEPYDANGKMLIAERYEDKETGRKMATGRVFDALGNEVTPAYGLGKYSDMPTGWICGQTARDFMPTRTGLNSSMNTQESAEFQTSKFYCKTDFDMSEIQEEEKGLQDPPKFYRFKSCDERERILYKNFIQVGEDVKAMLHEIQVFKAK